MSINNSTSASGSYITTTNSTTESYTAAVQATVIGVQPNAFATALSSATASTSSFAGGLRVPVRVTTPGVFTAGTPTEGTLSNPTNDSNA